VARTYDARTMPRVPFSSLRSLLEGFGFFMEAVPGSHILFQSEEPKHKIILRRHGPGDAVLPHEIVSVGHFLDAWGGTWSEMTSTS